MAQDPTFGTPEQYLQIIKESGEAQDTKDAENKVDAGLDALNLTKRKNLERVPAGKLWKGLQKIKGKKNFKAYACETLCANWTFEDNFIYTDTTKEQQRIREQYAKELNEIVDVSEMFKEKAKTILHECAGLVNDKHNDPTRATASMGPVKELKGIWKKYKVKKGGLKKTGGINENAVKQDMSDIPEDIKDILRGTIYFDDFDHLVKAYKTIAAHLVKDPRITGIVKVDNKFDDEKRGYRDAKLVVGLDLDLIPDAKKILKNKLITSMSYIPFEIQFNLKHGMVVKSGHLKGTNLKFLIKDPILNEDRFDAIAFIVYCIGELPEQWKSDYSLLKERVQTLYPQGMMKAHQAFKGSDPESKNTLKMYDEVYDLAYNVDNFRKDNKAKVMEASGVKAAREHMEKNTEKSVAAYDTYQNKLQAQLKAVRRVDPLRAYNIQLQRDKTWCKKTMDAKLKKQIKELETIQGSMRVNGKNLTKSQLAKIGKDIQNARIEREDLSDMRKTFVFVQDRRKRAMGAYLRERMLSEAKDDRAAVAEKHMVNKKDKQDKKSGISSGKKKTGNGNNDPDKKTKKKKKLTTKDQNDETVATRTGATRNRSNCNIQVPTKNKTGGKDKSGTKKNGKKAKK